jgi:hypothetical protein
MSAQSTGARSTAFRFVLVLGIANFFADMTYEGARSSTGQFLGTLGASAAVVAFTAGSASCSATRCDRFPDLLQTKRANTG